MSEHKAIGQYENTYHIFCKRPAITIRKKMCLLFGGILFEEQIKSHYLIYQIHQLECAEFFGYECFTILEKYGIGFHWDVHENCLNWWNMGRILS